MPASAAYFLLPPDGAAKPPVEGFLLVDGRGVCSHLAAHDNVASLVTSKTPLKGYENHLECDVEKKTKNTQLSGAHSAGVTGGG